MPSANNGFNPLRWKCQSGGCYNQKHRPKIEMFAPALPRNLAMTDVDATVELNGHFLFLEWKSGQPRDLPRGQRLYAEQLTKLSPKVTYVVVCGNAETMDVSHIQVVFGGTFQQWQECTFEELTTRVARWAAIADRRAVH